VQSCKWRGREAGNDATVLLSKYSAGFLFMSFAKMVRSEITNFYRSAKQLEVLPGVGRSKQLCIIP